jgi:hypothetical protein
MLEPLGDRISACLEQAERCRQAAASEPDERVRQQLLYLEQQWQEVAESFQLIERLQLDHALPPEVEKLPRTSLRNRRHNKKGSRQRCEEPFRLRGNPKRVRRPHANAPRLDIRHRLPSRQGPSQERLWGCAQLRSHTPPGSSYFAMAPSTIRRTRRSRCSSSSWVISTRWTGPNVCTPSSTPSP